ncbi:hypothetical protein ACJ73_08524 [Blastomyces percursus]|uniref:Uncharacterized protein n=1 Tax=Blastomyces percursus TaxID=1658174 RepID=A0A1J9QWA5_9EURO|nr:hypothetical protein ACJ73_08524 [Blastomyces percursus]
MLRKSGDEERPQAHVSPLRTFASRVLQQLSALKRKLRRQSMWAATNSAGRRTVITLGPISRNSSGGTHVSGRGISIISENSNFHQSDDLFAIKGTPSREDMAPMLGKDDRSPLKG